MTMPSDEALLRRALDNARTMGRVRRLRWVALADAFALGSPFAGRLCERFGLNPDNLEPPR